LLGKLAGKRIHIITVAAGSGSRFGGPLPKQFCDLAGRPVLMHTVDSLRRALPGASHTLVLSEHDHGLWRTLCDKHCFVSPRVVYGGDSRFGSVRNALVTVGEDIDIVMVHDGARPMPSPAMLATLVAAFDNADCQGALPSLPLTDSVRRIESDGSVAVNRADYRTVQTPQAFRSDVLMQAYAQASGGFAFTDDASVVEHAGFCKLALVPGDRHNIKITNPGDIELAEFFLEKDRCSR